MRALLAQVDSPGSAERGVEKVREAVSSDPELDLVAFPELYLQGYDLDTVAESALAADSDPIAALGELAGESETAIAVGFAERRGDSVANSLALFDGRGELAGIYRKTHLFGDECGVFAPGDELLVVNLGGLRVGPMICFDMEFCETGRALARAGADVLLTASANMEPFYADHLIASQARALDNRVPHLYVNRCGTEAGVRFVGGTRAIRPSGTIEAAVDATSEELLSVQVERPEPGDPRVDYLRHVREDLQVTEPITQGGTIR